MSPTSSSSSSVSRDVIGETLDTPDSLEENARPDQSDMLFAHSSVPGIHRTSLTLFCNSYLLQEFILCSIIIFLQAMCRTVTQFYYFPSDCVIP